METLKKGSTGKDVTFLQSCLNLLQDGIFGDITEEAVKNFQTANNLTSDGIVGPKTWELLSPAKATRKINTIILHCSATNEGKDYNVDTIRQWHIKRGFGDIGYHYVIYRDGTVHNGRNINKIGAHCAGHNTGSIGICYIGGLEADGKKAKDTRTKEQKIALVRLVKDLMKIYNISIDNIYCHNQFANKACPSFKIESFKSELKSLI